MLLNSNIRYGVKVLFYPVEKPSAIISLLNPIDIG